MDAESFPMLLYRSTMAWDGIPDLFRTVRENTVRAKCIVECDAVEHYLKDRLAFSPTDLDDDFDGIALSTLTLLPVWGLTKTIYRFDETLFEALAETDTQSIIPESLFDQLPVYCPYIEYPIIGPGGCHIHGFFVAKIHEHQENSNYLVLLILVKGESPTDPILKQVGIMLGTGLSIRKRLESSYTNMPADQYPPLAEIDSVYRKMLSPILYLCSAGADIRYRAPTTPSRHIANALPEKPRIADVGLRIGSAIRSYRIERAKQETEAVRTGRTLSPHVRRAHWHHFWTGRMLEPRTLILKWIPPIPVNLDKGELPVTIRPVKA